MNKKYIFLVIILISNFNLLISQSTSFNFFVGASFPSKDVSEFFANRLIETTDSTHKFLTSEYENVSIGYNISVRGNIDLSDKAAFFGSFGFHKFKVSDLLLLDNNKEKIGSMTVQQTIYPISAGINYYLIDGAIGVYINAGLNYNYSVRTLDQIDSKYILKLSQESSNSSLGFTTGIGTEIYLGKAAFVIEANYSNLNLIGKDSKSSSQSIISIKSGLKF